LIEDNEGSRFGFVRYFANKGFSVSEAATLSAAGSFLKQLNFDAVVLDINLPDGSGIDFIPTIRAQAPGIPVIVITGAGDDRLSEKALQNGADNFFTKPFDSAILMGVLRNFIEGSNFEGNETVL
jgi:two-component system response regulator TctD